MSSTSRSAPTTPIRTFKARTLHFLQVSPTQVVPVRLFLSAPSTFSEIVWQEILSVVQENIMEELYLSPHNGYVSRFERCKKALLRKGANEPCHMPEHVALINVLKILLICNLNIFHSVKLRWPSSTL
jgi:hypothetical protein